MGWRATYRLPDGSWTRKPLSLNTKDWDEACENARDRIAVLDHGGELPKAIQKVIRVEEHSLERYGQLAIKTLREKAEAAGRIHPGKAHKYLGLIRHVRCAFRSIVITDSV